MSFVSSSVDSEARLVSDKVAARQVIFMDVVDTAFESLELISPSIVQVLHMAERDDTVSTGNV